MAAYRRWDGLIGRFRERQETPSATGIGCTRHGETRMRQRGMKEGDADLILAYGTQVDAEAWFSAQAGCGPCNRVS